MREHSTHYGLLYATAGTMPPRGRTIPLERLKAPFATPHGAAAVFNEDDRVWYGDGFISGARVVEVRLTEGGFEVGTTVRVVATVAHVGRGWEGD